jgi:endo-1,4-beta-xylanase
MTAMRRPNPTHILLPTVLCMLMTTSHSLADTPALPSIAAVYKDHFYVGCAMSSSIVAGDGAAEARGMIAKQFNTISPENLLKWQPFNPRPGDYNHAPADAFVDFGRRHDMYVVGHVLFWHSQTPDWVFKDDQGKPLTREALLARMRQHVRHIAARYGDRINAWDVVNESIVDDGSLRDSEWTRIIGDDFIEQAFRIADEELPKSVELIYNDYSMEGPRKRDAVVKMVRDLKGKGVRIDGIGSQAHWSISGPSIDEIEASIVAFAATGVKVHFTELDVDVLPRHPQMWSGNADVQLRLQGDPSMNPFTDGLPEDMQNKLAARYADVFRLFVKHRDSIKRVTFWGDTDARTWLNGWPIRGRSNHPLLFDRQGKPKPAFFAVIDVVEQRGGK